MLRLLGTFLLTIGILCGIIRMETGISGGFSVACVFEIPGLSGVSRSADVRGGVESCVGTHGETCCSDSLAVSADAIAVGWTQ